MNLFQENTDVRTKADKHKAELDTIKDKLSSVKSAPAPGSVVRTSIHLPKNTPLVRRGGRGVTMSHLVKFPIVYFQAVCPKTRI